MNMRFLIASGGTGGHFYPGFALGKELAARGAKVLFVVRKNDPAAQVLHANGLPFVELDFTGLPRTLNPIKHLRFGWKLCKSLRQMRGIIRRFRPDAALGTGGYVSFPLIFTAWLCGVKTAVHDSNTKIGLANKVCGKFADLFLLGLPVTEKIKNAVLVSTPIRAEFALPADREKIITGLELNPAFPTVLVFGGSQGAKALNAAVISAARRLAQEEANVQFIHITGERWYEPIQAEYNQLPGVKVLPYAHNIYELIHAADAVVCRSGASTLAELIYCQKPAILVPYPHAAANHQYYNAKVLTDVDCALLVCEGENLENRLYGALKNALENISVMQLSYRESLLLPDPMTAAARIADLLQKL